MNKKIITVFVLFVLVVGLSSISVVAAAENGQNIVNPVTESGKNMLKVTAEVVATAKVANDANINKGTVNEVKETTSNNNDKVNLLNNLSPDKLKELSPDQVNKLSQFIAIDIGNLYRRAV
ncbi:MAG: hypothetical protein MJ224_04295 [archaeon]|nr:hypothetical protein [archaeon]